MRVSDLLRNGKTDVAAAVFDELLDTLPANARVWEAPAPADMEIAQSDEVYEKLASLRPKDRALHIARIHYLASQRRWPELPPLLETVIALDPADSRSWYNAAAVYLYIQDLPSYRRVCGEMLARFSESDGPNDCMRVATTCFFVTSPSGRCTLASTLAAPRALPSPCPSRRPCRRCSSEL